MMKVEHSRLIPRKHTDNLVLLTMYVVSQKACVHYETEINYLFTSNQKWDITLSFQQESEMASLGCFYLKSNILQ